MALPRTGAGAVAADLASYRDAIRQIDRDHQDALALSADRAELPISTLQNDRSTRVVVHHLSLDWSLIGALQLQLRWAQTQQAAAAEVAGLPTVEVTSLIDDSALRSLLPGAVGLPPPEPSAP